MSEEVKSVTTTEPESEVMVGLDSENEDLNVYLVSDTGKQFKVSMGGAKMSNLCKNVLVNLSEEDKLEDVLIPVKGHPDDFIELMAEYVNHFNGEVPTRPIISASSYLNAFNEDQWRTDFTQKMVDKKICYDFLSFSAAVGCESLTHDCAARIAYQLTFYKNAKNDASVLEEAVKSLVKEEVVE